MLEKKCAKCGVVKAVSGFYRHRGAKDGLQYYCKVCAGEYHRQYAQYKKDGIAEYHRRYKQVKKDRLATYHRQYKHRNKARVNEYARGYFQIPRNKAARSLRSRLWDALKGAHNSTKAVGLLGCSIEFFMEYIAAQFIEGMTWDNYGAWHLDHRRPCASFDLTDTTQQGECFHYSNLQPLWATDNLRKGAKWIDARA